MSKDLASLESGGTDLGISTVKVGADGKERAVLLRKSSVRWICLVFVALLLGGGGAWYVYRERQVHAAEMDRLTRLLRSTGERVQSLQRVQDRLEASKSTDEVKEQVAKEMHLGSEVRDAEVDHARAQAAMMKRGLPSGEHQAAADKAALQVPKEMQRKMINEFQLKSSFLVWATTAEREAAWRASVLKRPSFAVVPPLAPSGGRPVGAAPLSSILQNLARRPPRRRKSPHFDKKLSDAQSDRRGRLLTAVGRRGG